MLTWLKEKIQITEFETLIKSFSFNQIIDFIDFAICVVLADHKVEEAEKKWLQQICLTFGIDVNEYMNSNAMGKTIDDIVSGIKTFNNDQLDFFLSAMVTGMASDGEISVEEEELLELIMNKMNISEERVESAIDRINKMALDFYQKKIQ